jgi:hypothetical protein
LRLAAKANSDMAKMPLMSVNSAINKKSIPPLCQDQTGTQRRLQGQGENERHFTDNVAFETNGSRKWQFIGLATFRVVTPRWANSWTKLVFQPAAIVFTF